MIIKLALVFWGLFTQNTNPATSTFVRPGIDTNRYAILTYTKSRDNFLFKEGQPATIAESDLVKIEKIIAVAVDEYNKGIKLEDRKIGRKPSKASPKRTISKPDKYFKQVIAIINNDGQKEVWVNCFCTAREKKYWRKGVVLILDGGPCFFNLKINLSTNTVMNSAVNGVS